MRQRWAAELLGFKAELGRQAHSKLSSNNVLGKFKADCNNQGAYQKVRNQFMMNLLSLCGEPMPLP
ncbi:MAG TPA: hypothetical protein DCL66_09260 [Gammaproteobacteria bacterium]|nr:hypothetical protein [Gammaproteobacteria bacterium]